MIILLKNTLYSVLIDSIGVIVIIASWYIGRMIWHATKDNKTPSMQSYTVVKSYRLYSIIDVRLYQQDACTSSSVLWITSTQKMDWIKCDIWTWRIVEEYYINSSAVWSAIKSMETKCDNEANMNRHHVLWLILMCLFVSFLVSIKPNFQHFYTKELATCAFWEVTFALAQEESCEKFFLLMY